MTAWLVQNLDALWEEAPNACSARQAKLISNSHSFSQSANTGASAAVLFDCMAPVSGPR